jgi:hypothetical protein
VMGLVIFDSLKVLQTMCNIGGVDGWNSYSLNGQ